MGLKVYRVDILIEGEGVKTRLIEESSAAKAREHALKILTVRNAKQADMLLAIGEDAIPIEKPYLNDAPDNAA